MTALEGARALLYRRVDELEAAVHALPDTDPARGALIDQINHLRFLLSRDGASRLAMSARTDRHDGADGRKRDTGLHSEDAD